MFITVVLIIIVFLLISVDFHWFVEFHGCLINRKNRMTRVSLVSLVAPPSIYILLCLTTPTRLTRVNAVRFCCIKSIRCSIQLCDSMKTIKTYRNQYNSISSLHNKNTLQNNKTQ